jgi:hypothetical protein
LLFADIRLDGWELKFAAQLLDWREAGAMGGMGSVTMLVMAAGIAACVYMLG